MCINSFCSFTSADGIDFEFYSLRIHVLLKRTEELLKDLGNGRVRRYCGVDGPVQNL